MNEHKDTDNEDNENESLSDLIEKYKEQNKMYCFEGTSGVNKLKKLLGAIGYSEGNYLGYDNEIINFLSDNSGAIEVILEWISEQNVAEWGENLESLLDDKENSE